MAPRFVGSLSLLALVGTAFSKPLFPEPTITDPAVMRDGVSPVPTNGPRHELVKRDLASSDTCGWITSTRIMTCDGYATCAFVTAGSFSLQGCCDGIGALTDCNFATTCYDYTAYTAGGCDTNCQFNQLNMVCSDVLEPSCRFYEYPNGASGFGCNTIGGTVTVTPGSGTLSAVVPTAGADQFSSVLSLNAPISAALSSSGPFYTGGSTGGTNLGSTYGFGAAAATLATGAIAGIAIFGVGYGCWYIAAAVVIFMMCKRSKRLTAAWDQPGGANYRGVPPAAGGDGSNVVAPYTAAAAVPTMPDQAMTPQVAQPTYFAPPEPKGVSPQQTSVSPVYGPGSPAPSYSQANVSPYQGQQQPVQQPVQPYGYPAQQQYVEAPAPAHQAEPQHQVSELQ